VGSVAQVQDEYTLLMSRGSEHGVTADMEFVVMADEGGERPRLRELYTRRASSFNKRQGSPIGTR
jgi:hypothetical protein